MHFPGGSDSKESTCNAGGAGLSPGSGRSPGGGHGNPLQYFCLENPHGQRSLEGYSPQGCTESDMTEQLTLSLWVSLVAQLVKNLPAMQETLVRFLDWEDPLEKVNVTHFSILGWRIP